MNIEFYMDSTGTFPKVIYFKLDRQDWRKFDDLTELEVETMFDHLVRIPKMRIAMLHLSRFISKGKREILRQFIGCNWTKLDRVLDISDTDVKFENIYCPFKCSLMCPFKGMGIVCQKH